MGRALGADQEAVGAAHRRRPRILEGVRGARRGGGATEQPLDERRRPGPRAPSLRALENKRYVDELYEAIVVRPLEKISMFFWRGIDLTIDGVLSLAAYLVALVGDLLRFFQTGNVRNYALMFFVGVIVFVWVFA